MTGKVALLFNIVSSDIISLLAACLCCYLCCRPKKQFSSGQTKPKKRRRKNVTPASNKPLLKDEQCMMVAFEIHNKLFHIHIANFFFCPLDNPDKMKNDKGQNMKMPMQILNGEGGNRRGQN